jgi:hypothetical protein
MLAARYEHELPVLSFVIYLLNREKIHQYLTSDDGLTH